MAPRQLCEVILSCLGVYFVVAGLPNLLVLLFTSWGGSGEPGADLPFWLALAQLLPILAGVGLILLRGILSRGLVPSAEGAGAAPHSLADLQAVGLSGIGAYLAILGLSSGIPSLGLGLGFPEALRSGTQAAMGLGLFFGARGVARLWQLLRTRRLPTQTS